MAGLKELKELSGDFSVMCVTSNEKLRKGIVKFLERVFYNVHSAADAKEAFTKYNRLQPSIVITDIKLPDIDGVTLLKNLKKNLTKTQFIVLLSIEEEETVSELLSLGVRYLHKPFELSELSRILYSILKKLHKNEEKRLFTQSIKNVFIDQNIMVAMMKNQKPVFANQAFLDFFSVDDVESFNTTYEDLGTLFLEHEGFLYSSKEKGWCDELMYADKKAFNVLLKNKEGIVKHFILKYQQIPQKDQYAICSFDDVSDLNIVNLYNSSIEECDHHCDEDKDAMFELLEKIKQNNIAIELHNYYKGLSITNNATILEVTQNSITLKTNYIQEKAIQFEKQTLLVSEALPHAILCQDLSNINFNAQKMELKNIRFVASSPVTRANIRVVPEEEHSVQLYIKGKEFHGDVCVQDISINAFKLGLNAYPAGLKIGDKIRAIIQLYHNDKPWIFDVQGEMFRKYEREDMFDLVFSIEFAPGQKSELIKYITKRQMSIIREFKGLQNG